MKNALLMISVITSILTSSFSWAQESGRITTTRYSGSSKVNLTYVVTGWNKNDGWFIDSKCGTLNTIVTGIFTLGIYPLSECLKNVNKTNVVPFQLSALINATEAGRARIQLNSSSEKNCTGFSIPIFAEEDGFGGYQMYSSKENWSNGVSMGTIMRTSNTIVINIQSSETLLIKTAGKNGGECIWDLGTSFSTELSSKSSRR